MGGDGWGEGGGGRGALGFHLPPSKIKFPLYANFFGQFLWPLLNTLPYNLLPPSRALMCLNELSLTREMADLTRNNLFPSAKEVSILSVMCPRLATDPETPEAKDREEERRTRFQ